MGAMCRGAHRLGVGHWHRRHIVAVRSDVARHSGRRIASDLVAAQTMLLEPAMQDIGMHAMFTRCGGNRCTGLQARGDQFSLELWCVGAAHARHRITRGLRIFEHRVHGGFVDAILLKELFRIKMGLPAGYQEMPELEAAAVSLEQTCKMVLKRIDELLRNC